MDAVTSSSPPAGAPTLALVVWIRPDVQEPPWFSAVMSRLPLPSRWTLLDEFVMVSISPVPKLEPGPVSYCQADEGPLPEETLKSSLKIVDQPEGGPGTAAGAATAVSRAARAADTGAAGGGGSRRPRGGEQGGREQGDDGGRSGGEDPQAAAWPTTAGNVLGGL